MKKRLLPLILLFSISCICFSQNRYVDSSATNVGDGTSWLTAYNDLQLALNDPANPDTIFVAEGTYTPDTLNGSPDATFYISKNVVLLGGYPTGGGIRNPQLYHTVLSGDLNGDDVDDDFVNSKSDNVKTVVWVASNITDSTEIDGFIIEYGHADGTQNNHQQRGGGVYSEGVPIIKNCNFKQNYASKEGGAVYKKGQAGESLLIENCRLESNRSNYGGGISIEATNFQLNYCDFINNSAVDGAFFQVRGGGMYLTFASGSLQGCNFTGNTSTEFGGGLFALNTQGDTEIVIELFDCIFQSNIAESGGGGAYLVNANFIVQGCQFLENEANISGGGLIIHSSQVSSNDSFVVDNCTFQANNSGDDGSGINSFLHGQDVQFEMKNCQLTDNVSGGEGTVSLWGSYGATGIALIDSCHFQNNTAVYAGGLTIGNTLNGGATIEYTLSNSTFLENEAMEDGALEFACEDNSVANILVENCTIQGNKSMTRGGAVGFFPGCENFNVTLNRCVITDNESPSRGAVNSYMFYPGVQLQQGASIQIENTLIANNDSDDVVIGLEETYNLSLLNCTVVNNTSGGIELLDQSGLTLQNTILANPGHTEYMAADGAVFTSSGGNLVLDNSLNAYLTATDKPETEPGFALGTYESSASSPLINGGNNDGVTATLDLAGNPRIQHGIVDIGAYESPYSVSVREVFAGELEVSPNPAFDYLSIELPESIVNPLEANLFDFQGRLTNQFILVENQAIKVNHLTPGMYLLKVVDKDTIYTGKFLKQ